MKVAAVVFALIVAAAANMQDAMNIDMAAEGFDPSAVSPDVFFKMHDYNNDKYLDETELAAVYKTLAPGMGKSPDDDVTFREVLTQVYNEVDLDGDKRISYDEFLKSSSQN